MADVLTEAQLVAALGGPQPEGIAISNLIRTLFATKEGQTAAVEPAAGQIGQAVTADVLAADEVSLVTNTAKTVVSVSLPAGDWDIFGVVTYDPAATTSITYLSQSISAATNTHGTNKNRKALASAAVVPGATNVPIMDTPVARVNISAPTTYYLVATATFTVDTLKAYGSILARRVS